MTKQIQDAYIVAATRTPVGKAPKGMFRNTRPDDMLAHVLRSVVAQAPGVDVNRIDDAIIGCAMPEAEQGMNVARIGVLLAGLPNTIAAQTVNRFCSSGLQAVAQAADAIRLGNADLMLAGGTESMSMVPMMGNKIAMAPSVFDNDHVAIAYGMGITAEKVAEEWKVSREDQDAFALASHQKAMAAIQNGEFKDEISPYEIVSHLPDLADGQRIITRNKIADTDEGPRPDSSAEGLAKLRPVFRNGQFGGTVTAGNSAQMSDGAGAVLLASEQAIKDYGLTPLARFVSFSVAGVRPEVIAIMNKLREQGDRVVILSNTNRLHCQFWPSQSPQVQQAADKVYLSQEMGLRKPDKKIYERLLNEEETSAQEAIFFDDNLENIEGARAVGIHSLHITDAKVIPAFFADRIKT